jgi:hypothetical protein
MKYFLTIGWLYPDLMSIYGDRGNITALIKRSEWRGISTLIKRIGLDSTEKDLASCNLLMMGGAQDSQQTIVAKDLSKKKKVLLDLIESEIPGIYVCGGFQFLGHYYKEADGTKIEQLGVLDVYTENPGRERLIGNIAVKVENSKFSIKDLVVGFENHGGRTILGENVEPLGKVISGFGSNDTANEEGAVYKNSIGTYLHGPILPKNPEIADWLISKALEREYPSISSDEIQKIMKPLDDSIAKKAKQAVLNKMGMSPR